MLLVSVGKVLELLVLEVQKKDVRVTSVSGLEAV